MRWDPVIILEYMTPDSMEVKPKLSAVSVTNGGVVSVWFMLGYLYFINENGRVAVRRSGFHGK